MSLTFGGATSDQVAIGTTAISSSTMTILAWVNITTLTGGRGIYSGRADGSVLTSNVQFRLNLTGGNVEIRVSRATTALSYVTNSTPLATTSAWRFIAVTFDLATAAHVYSGSLTAAAAEATYGTTTLGTGTILADGSGSNIWGNRISTGTTTNALQGQIAWGQIYNRVLTLGEIQSLQFSARPLSGCLAYHQFGFNGVSTQPDWSGNGNAGTVTGATQSAHVPLGPMFGFSPMRVPYVVAAAGGFLPAWARGSNQLIGGGGYVS